MNRKVRIPVCRVTDSMMAGVGTDFVFVCNLHVLSVKIPCGLYFKVNRKKSQENKSEKKPKENSNKKKRSQNKNVKENAYYLYTNEVGYDKHANSK